MWTTFPQSPCRRAAARSHPTAYRDGPRRCRRGSARRDRASARRRSPGLSRRARPRRSGVGPVAARFPAQEVYDRAAVELGRHLDAGLRGAFTHRSNTRLCSTTIRKPSRVQQTPFGTLKSREGANENRRDDFKTSPTVY